MELVISPYTSINFSAILDNWQKGIIITATPDERGQILMQQQGIVKGDVLQRIASVGLILGAILMIIAGILYPRISDASSTQEWLQTYGDQELLTQICKFLFSIGIWAVMAGAMGIYRSISARGAAWARLGFYGILAGTAMFTIAWALTSFIGTLALAKYLEGRCYDA